MTVAKTEIKGHVGIGILLEKSDYNIIQSVKLISSDAELKSLGMRLYLSNSNHIVKNNFQALSGGIYIGSSNDNKLEHNLTVLKPTSYDVAWYLRRNFLG